MRRRWVLLLGIPLAGALLGLALGHWLWARYQAVSLLAVNSRMLQPWGEVRAPSAPSLARLASGSRFREVLSSRLGQSPSQSEKAGEWELEATAEGGGWVRLRGSAGSRELALEVANTATAVLTDLLETWRRREVERRTGFLEGRIRETRDRLQELSQELEDFKVRNSRALGLRVESLAELEERLGVLEASLGRLGRAVDVLTEQPHPSTLALLPGLDDWVLSTLLRQWREVRLHLEVGALQPPPPEPSPERERLQEEDERLFQQVMRRLVQLREEKEGERERLQARRQRLLQVPRLMSRLEALEYERNLQRETLSTLLAQLQEVQLQGVSVTPAEVLQEASEASLDWMPLLPAALCGLLGGLLLAWLWHAFPSRPPKPSRAARLQELLQVPILGVIPSLPKTGPSLNHLSRPLSREEEEAMGLLAAHFAPRSPAVESLREILGGLQAILGQRGGKGIGFMSLRSQEGTSTVAANVALLWAQKGRRVLLVDAHLAQPRLASIFGVSGHPGLREILEDGREWTQVLRSIDDLILGRFGLDNVRQTPGLEFLFLLPAGRPGPDFPAGNALEVWGRLWAEWQERFDMIVVDLPPLSSDPAAQELVSRLPCLALVHRPGRLKEDLLASSCRDLEQKAWPVVGAILNDADGQFSPGEREALRSAAKSRQPSSNPSPATRPDGHGEGGAWTEGGVTDPELRELMSLTSLEG